MPEEIIVDAMLMHQRYFPLYDEDGKLTNKFIVVTNGDPAHAATITDGNERVVRARLSDAKFFYEEDLKHPLETYVRPPGRGGVPGSARHHEGQDRPHRGARASPGRRRAAGRGRRGRRRARRVPVRRPTS